MRDRVADGRRHARGSLGAARLRSGLPALRTAAEAALGPDAVSLALEPNLVLSRSAARADARHRVLDLVGDADEPHHDRCRRHRGANGRAGRRRRARLPSTPPEGSLLLPADGSARTDGADPRRVEPLGEPPRLARRGRAAEGTDRRRACPCEWRCDRGAPRCCVLSEGRSRASGGLSGRVCGTDAAVGLAPRARSHLVKATVESHNEDRRCVLDARSDPEVESQRADRGLPQADQRQAGTGLPARSVPARRWILRVLDGGDEQNRGRADGVVVHGGPRRSRAHDR